MHAWAPATGSLYFMIMYQNFKFPEALHEDIASYRANWAEARIGMCHILHAYNSYHAGMQCMHANGDYIAIANVYKVSFESVTLNHQCSSLWSSFEVFSWKINRLWLFIKGTHHINFLILASYIAIHYSYS